MPVASLTFKRDPSLSTVSSEESVKTICTKFDLLIYFSTSSPSIGTLSAFLLSPYESYDGWLNYKPRRTCMHNVMRAIRDSESDPPIYCASSEGRGNPNHDRCKYNSPFDVSPLKVLEGWYNKMHRMDREKSCHSGSLKLYSVWNAKPFFVDDNHGIRVMEAKGKTYDYVLWWNGGSFKEINLYKNWPDPIV